MSRLIGMNSARDRFRGSAFSTAGRGWPYVLVVDSNVQRIAACLEAMNRLHVSVVVAHNREEADHVLQGMGTPVALLADLSLPQKDGFDLIETLRGQDRHQPEIVAWSSSGGLREFALHRLAGLNVKIFGPAVAHAVVGAVVERAVQGGPALETASTAPPTDAAEDLHRTMTELSQKARQLCGTAGAAVYMKASGETEFRASVSWDSDSPVPHSLCDMPRIFSWVLATGETVIVPDLVVTTQSLSQAAGAAFDDVRGLMAVPIMGDDDEIVGTICVFDVKPLTFVGAHVDALKALGRRAPVRQVAGPMPSPVVEKAPRTRAPRAPAPPVPRPHLVDGPSPGSPSALLDRRGGDLAIARELDRMRRERRQLCVVLLDVDPRQDPDAEEAADSVTDALVGAAETLTRAIRGSDLAIRWSDEELLLVLPGLGMAEARPVAERVRAAVQAGARHRAAVSGGIAEIQADETFESVVGRANERVRLAREYGHNRLA